MRSEKKTACFVVWADNGDACSIQYAGTCALKADYTRTGKRSFWGALQDGQNAITRYFRNNFLDGYRQVRLCCSQVERDLHAYCIGCTRPLSWLLRCQSRVAANVR